MKTSGIYIIINTINDKKYVGSSKNIYQRKRTHLHKLRHNKHEYDYLQKSFNKHGEKNFQFIIVFQCSEEILITKEKEYMILYNALDRKFGYNISPEPKNKIVSAETRKKLSILAQNRTAEHRKKIGESRKGWNPSKETRKNMSISHIGYVMPEEQKKKISQSLKGKKKSKETRQKLSNSLKGRIISLEQREKIRKTLTGYKHTEESRENNRQAKLKMSKETKKKIADSNRGSKHTEESKEKMRQTRLEYYRNKKNENN